MVNFIGDSIVGFITVLMILRWFVYVGVATYVLFKINPFKAFVSNLIEKGL